MEILSAKDWYYDQLRKQSGKTMSHFELAENYSKYLLEQQERSYSEEDMKSFADWCRNGLLNTEYSVDRLNEHLEQWKQFKKK